MTSPLPWLLMSGPSVVVIPGVKQTMILGVLGGSGLYELDGLEEVREEKVATPFGEPSAPLVRGHMGGAEVVFLARHGRGHRHAPSEINYRANIHALKQAGVERVLSISAVGSLREGIAPGDLVLVDQFIDRTHRRESTFFGAGVVGHVSFAAPVCPDLIGAVAAAALEVGFVEAAPEHRLRSPVPSAATSHAGGGRPGRLHRGGTYVCMEGPQFSTRAESNLHRSWGADAIGMTAATEAKLCREAELCFSSASLVTDYDCWHEEEAAVSVEGVLAVLAANIVHAKQVLHRVLPHLQSSRGCACGRAAENAIVTSRDAIPAAARERLRFLFGRYL
jgi:5'-methylthioadenosine phosphorylase